MVVAGTYPLHPSVQAWSDPKSSSPTWILFANESYQGCYNAALAHLARGMPGEEKTRQDKILARMLDYGWTASDDPNTVPPVWISVVASNGQLLPVKHVPGESYRCEVGDCEAELEALFKRPWPESETEPKPKPFAPVAFPPGGSGSSCLSSSSLSTSCATSRGLLGAGLLGFGLERWRCAGTVLPVQATD